MPAGHDLDEAARALAARDPVVARLVAEFGLPVVSAPFASHFAALVRSITYQQLATPAARAIHGRLVEALANEVTPERLLATPTGQLRTAGLSGGKAASLQDLATKVLDGSITLEQHGLDQESDEEIVSRLSTVRGIGRWSAEMFLIFQLRRPDVWPTGDLAVRRGFGRAWDIETPTPKVLEALGEPFRPYRTTLAWYCWRAAAA